MFKIMNTIRLLKPLIGILLVLCYLVTIGCNGSGRVENLLKRAEKAESDLAIERNNLRKARRDLEIANTARDAAVQRAEKAESDLRKARRDLEIANMARDAAVQRAEKAESDLRKARRDLEIANMARDAAVQRAEKAESDLAIERNNLRKARRDLEIANTARDTAVQRAEKVESDLRKAYKNLKTANAARDAAVQRAEKSAKERDRAYSERDRARQRARISEEEKKKLEKLVRFVPRATITNVRIVEKQKDIDIFVTFGIENRRGMEGSVNGSFYFQSGKSLVDKNGPISISKEFTPDSVKDTLTVKLPMSHAKLNLAQPSDLIFKFRIYDKSTNDFLDQKPYSKTFRFDPHKN